ncbi:MAG: hypothetical protein ACWA5X_10090 [bacterium]
MDEDHYRETYSSVNQRRCAFEKAVLTKCVHCSRAGIFCLAERQGVACHSEVAQKQCYALLVELRERSRFALGIPNIEDQLPHAKEIKVQRGGLLGIREVMGDSSAIEVPIDDVHRLVNSATDRFGAIESLPFDEIVKSVVKFEGRRRRKKTP